MILPIPQQHPGKMLAEVYMPQMGLSQSELARRCCCSERKIDEIVNGKRGITASFAIVLESVLSVSAETWVEMQAKYDLAEARRHAA